MTDTTIVQEIVEVPISRDLVADVLLLALLGVSIIGYATALYTVIRMVWL